VPVLVVAYLLFTFAQVWHATSWEADHSADAVVVLGAAQYNGRPSPVLQGRLDHALAVWRSHRAGVIVLTGYKKSGDTFTEAYSGFQYLRRKGVPERDLIVVDTGTNTWESVAATERVIRKRSIRSVILVSDPYHSFRLVGVAEEVGMSDVQVSSTGQRAGLGQLVRETGAVSLGRIIGYRRVARLLEG
jgi:uncharacterized SAM-binding protein YcdF (DUF218 family)